MNSTTSEIKSSLNYDNYTFPLENVPSIHQWLDSSEYDFMNGSENYTYINCNLTATPFPSECFRAFIYLMYALVFVVSVIGNGIVCYIVIATPRMRTVTNYFIANLAFGDMLITIMCVPFTSISQVQQFWPFYNFLCPVVPYVQAVSVFVSTYTLVAISVDRYIAIMWPLKPRLTKRTSGLVIFVVWVFAAITGMPISMVTKTKQPAGWYIECDIYMCQEDWNEIGLHYAPMYSKILLILQFVIPVSVLLFTYTSIGIVIWCHQIPGEAEDDRDQRIARSKRKMVRMMVAVVMVYTICWLPLNVYWLLHDMDIRMANEEIYWFCSHWFAMSHPCYNPIIYCYMNRRFRQNFAQIFSMVPCLRARCAEVAMINQHGRTSRMSIPLTSKSIHRRNGQHDSSSKQHLYNVHQHEAEEWQ